MNTIGDALNPVYINDRGVPKKISEGAGALKDKLAIGMDANGALKATDLATGGAGYDDTKIATKGYVDKVLPSVPSAGRLVELDGGKYHVKVDSSLKNTDGSVKSADFVGIGTNGQLVARTGPASLSILDVYPVGSVYISLSSTFDPNTWGGTWTRFGAGRCLWGVGSNNSGLGSNIEAGLPDIEGEYPFGADGYNISSYSTDSDNAFYFNGTWSDNTHHSSWGNTQEYSWLKAKFKASRHNSIYGNSDTVQPPAVKCVFWKRTA